MQMEIKLSLLVLHVIVGEGEGEGSTAFIGHCSSISSSNQHGQSIVADSVTVLSVAVQQCISFSAMVVPADTVCAQCVNVADIRLVHRGVRVSACVCVCMLTESHKVKSSSSSSRSKHFTSLQRHSMCHWHYIRHHYGSIRRWQTVKKRRKKKRHLWRRRRGET